MMEYAGQPLSHTGMRAGIAGQTGSSSSASSGIPVAQHHQLAPGTLINNANLGGMVPQLYPVQQQYPGTSAQHYPSLPAGSGGTASRRPSAAQLYQNGAFPPNSMSQAQSAPQQQNGYMPQQQHARPPPNGGQYAQQQYVASGSGHAGPSQGSRPATAMQAPRPAATMQAPQASSSHHRQASQPGNAHPSQGPYPIASAQSRSAPQSALSVVPLQPRPPQQNQNHTTGSSQQSSEALPTPPPTAHPDSGGAKRLTIHEASNMMATNALKPLHDTIAASLSIAHRGIADEYGRMHYALANSENRLRAVLAKCGELQQECARLTVERDAALKVAEQFKKDKESAMEDVQKMNVNLPKLVVEYFELKSEHALLQQKMATVEEENAQLREKAQANPTPIYSYDSMMSAIASPVEQKVKLEKSPLVVKQERQSAPDSPPSDPDTAFAVQLAQEHEQRKRKQRDIDELQDLLRQTDAFNDFPMLPLMPSTSYLPPTPTSPISQSFPSEPTPAASSSAAPASDNQPDAPSRAVKAEQCEARVHFGIPDLDHTNISGELEIIDLTDAASSPMQLTSDLPPFSRRVQDEAPLDRKRVLLPEEKASEQPNKRQRTDGGETAVQRESVDADKSMDDAQPAATVDVAMSVAPSSRDSDSEMRPAGVPVTTPVTSSDVKPVLDTEPTSDVPMEPKAEPPAPEVPSLPPLPVMPASIVPPPPPPTRTRPIVPLSTVPPPSSVNVMAPTTAQPTPTQSPTVADVSKLSLPSSLSAVQLPPPVVVRATPAKSLGLSHMSLMYDNIRNKLYCRVCVARAKQYNTPVSTLPEDADWPTLRGHYEQEHPASCEKLVAMTPEQIREKKAENESKKVPFPFVTKKRKSAP